MRIAGMILASAWMYGVMILTALAGMVLLLPWLALSAMTGRTIRAATRSGIWWYGRACSLAARPAVRIAVNDASALAHSPAAVVVANHQSFFDTYLLGAQDADNVGMLIKGWPFRKLFFFRPLMRMAGYIETEGAPPEELLARCREELAGGGHLLGFPEGTRCVDGKLGRFHSGMFMLAVETGAPVVPMVIHDSRRVLPKGSRLFRPGTVHIDFLPPVDAGMFADEAIPHGALRRHVRALMADRLEKGPTAHGECGACRTSSALHAPPAADAACGAGDCG